MPTFLQSLMKEGTVRMDVEVPRGLWPTEELLKLDTITFKVNTERQAHPVLGSFRRCRQLGSPKGIPRAPYPDLLCEIGKCRDALCSHREAFSRISNLN